MGGCEVNKMQMLSYVGLCLVSCLAAHHGTQFNIRNSAIDAGVGRWTVDKHGSKEFQWVTNRVLIGTSIGTQYNLSVPKTVSIPWDDAWTNGFVVEPLAQWRKFNTPKCDCRLREGTTILPHYSGTNYTIPVPMPYEPGIWTGTNVMKAPNFPPSNLYQLYMDHGIYTNNLGL
jgi:hypothetical protein